MSEAGADEPRRAPQEDPLGDHRGLLATVIRRPATVLACTLLLVLLVAFAFGCDDTTNSDGGLTSPDSGVVVDTGVAVDAGGSFPC